ncbi:MAG: hypothetical protein ACPGYT_05750 [Nitrospirales bacterium]
MGVVVRQADLNADRDQIIELQKKYLTNQSGIQRFDWLYKKNPFGLPHVWVAQDSSTSTVIGAAAAFPRSLYIGLQKKIGWVLGDFCISEEYRSLGPAIQLQRACLEGVNIEGNTIWYDFPSEKMLAIYKRLKISSPGKMIRFVKPLKVDRKVRAWVNSPLLQRCINGIGNRILDVNNRRGKVSTGLTLDVHVGEYGYEFTELSEKVGDSVGNCLERTAAFLEWRYKQNPLGDYVMITARLDGELKGYAVFTETESDAILIDIFGFRNEPIIVGLLHDIVGRVRLNGCETLEASLVEGHPWIPFLQSVGFKPRETAPVIIAGVQNESVCSANSEPQASILLMQGDRDS